MRVWRLGASPLVDLKPGKVQCKGEGVMSLAACFVACFALRLRCRSIWYLQDAA
jgi:hypothetical protein